MDKQNEFKSFGAPPSKYRMYQMVHEPEGRPTTEFTSISAGGIVSNSDWRPGKYLTPENLDETNAFLSGMQNAGLGTWIYDDHLYPSGTAETKVLDGHMQYQAVGLRELSLSGTGQGAKTLAVPQYTTGIVSAKLYTDSGVTDVPVTHDAREIATNGADGDWELRAYVEFPALEGDRGFNVQANGVAAVNRKYVNIIDQDAVNRFLDLTYKAYRAHLTDETWRGIEAFFTDEPSLITRHHMDFSPDDSYTLLPWCDELPQKFRETFGYDVMEHLPSLFSAGGSDQDKTVRQNFYSLVGDLVSEIYFGTLQDWCAANGTRLSGHLLLEENLKDHVGLYGDVMKCFRRMGAPGIDVLTVYPDKFIGDDLSYNGNMIGAKFASSAAYWYGKDTVMAELCPVQPDANGWENDPAYVENAMGMMTLGYFGGVTHYNSYFTVKSPADGVKLNSYTSRLGYMLSQAEKQSRVSVYYPIETAQAEYTFTSKNIGVPMPAVDDLNANLLKLSRSLLSAGIDYEFITDQEILDAQSSGGGLTFGGKRTDVLIFPFMEVIPADVLAKAKQAEAQGMTVIWAGRTPTLGTAMTDHEAVRTGVAGESAVTIPEAVRIAKEAIGGAPASSAAAPEGVYASEFKTQSGRRMVYIVNATGRDLDDIMVSTQSTTLELYNPMDGSVQTKSSREPIAVRSYRGVFVVEK